MSQRRAFFLLSLLSLPCLGWSLPALADSELITDRPDQTESTAIVGRGVLQLETGFVLERDESDDLVEESRAWGGTLLRWGFSQNFELRIGFDGYLEQTTETAFDRVKESGSGDAELGFKLRLREGNGLSPSIAVLASTTIPVGKEGFSSERFDPTLRLSVAHDLADGIGLGWNLGVRRESTPGPAGSEHQDFAFYSASLGVSAGGKWGSFYEVFGEAPIGSSEGEDSHSFDTGLTYALGADTQLDLAAGLRLAGAAPDKFVGLGVTWRFR